MIARKLMDEGFYDKSVYHAQQSIEKFVKTILSLFGIFQKAHIVGKILIEALHKEDISRSWKDKLLKIAEISEGIEPEVSLSRYPGIIDDSLWLPFEEYEKEDAEKAIERSGYVFVVVKDFPKYWFPDEAKNVS